MMIVLSPPLALFFLLLLLDPLNCVVGAFNNAKDTRIDSTVTTSNDDILVTGATGRTGSLVYHQLRQHYSTNNDDSSSFRKTSTRSVRALVRNITKAKELLNCHKCDESEGIYVGDVSDITTLYSALDGVSTVVMLAAASGYNKNSTQQRMVEFDGVVNTLQAMVSQDDHHPAIDKMTAILCSSMGTTTPPAHSFGGDILFWKLNAEAFLSTSGIGKTAIVKPCGLVNGPKGNATLVAGNLDELFNHRNETTFITRGNVAAVLTEMVYMSDHALPQNMRFDLCSIPGGRPTTDLAGFLEKEATWPWERKASTLMGLRGSAIVEKEQE